MVVNQDESGKISRNDIWNEGKTRDMKTRYWEEEGRGK